MFDEGGDGAFGHNCVLIPFPALSSCFVILSLSKGCRRNDGGGKGLLKYEAKVNFLRLFRTYFNIYIIWVNLKQAYNTTITLFYSRFGKQKMYLWKH